MDNMKPKNLGPNINWSRFDKVRERQGSRFFEHFGYFREDGKKSIQAIEDAMRNMDPAGMIVPANRLMEDAEMYGAETLADQAAAIQMAAQNCVSRRERPDHMLRDVLSIRPLYFTSIVELEKHVTPLSRKKKDDGGWRVKSVSQHKQHVQG